MEPTALAPLAPLAPLDPLDLKLLHALQLDGRAPFSRIAQVLGVSDQTVARRYRRLHTSARLRVLGVTDENRLGRSSWIVRLRCTPDTAERLAGALALRPDTSWVTLNSGGTEVTCTMKPRDREARDKLLLDRLQRTPRVMSVSAHCVLHFFYGGALGWLNKSAALSPAEEAALRPPPVETVSGPVTLDAEDEALLTVLGRDGRATLTELQTATGQPESTVKRRLERLRSSGVLYFDVQHDFEPLGHEMDALLWLTVTPAALASVGEALAGHPEVQFAAATTGRANLVAATLHRSGAELYAYLSEKIGALEGVQSVETVLTLRRVKQLSYEPLTSGTGSSTAGASEGRRR
ncbi:Lrp/AsnC family transcriptional regulator [Streptomyces lincolnensis]|uniref:Lrp/AsnC family transcriptional regulator n=1 Tax=Streptomyces lincolnensis TaxID=1915 RepID=UPI001E3FD75B|nr:AsnC family transcriptional regulator [Streptomyces lincolnensis]MCD7439273.1 Lrp/AsnC family transcriptional regulator [Streptomyces lincolnensis]